MIDINNINDLLHLLHDILGSEYTVDVTDGMASNDAIKVTKQGSSNEMCIAFDPDPDFPDVILAMVYDGDPESVKCVFWDTEDPQLTYETIIDDIKKSF